MISTDAILALLGIQALLWEIWTIVNKKAGDTISATLRRLGEAQTFIPLACGALMRHLWEGSERCMAAYRAGWEAGIHWPLIDGQESKPSQ